MEEKNFNAENAALISHRNVADRNASQSGAMLNLLTGVTMEAVEGSAEAGSVKLRLLNETDLEIMFGSIRDRISPIGRTACKTGQVMR